MQSARVITRYLFSAVVIVFLSGCSTLKATLLPTSQFVSTLTTSADLNPNQQARPSPLVVKFFQLKDDKSFTSAGFFDLYDNAKQSLGDNLLASKTMQLVPNNHYRLTWKINKDAKYIGVVAAYSNLDQAKWHAVIPIKSDWGKTKMTINFDKDSIMINKGKS